MSKIVVLMLSSLVWVAFAALCYLWLRYCTRSKTGRWTCVDRRDYITLSLLGGPISLALCLMMWNPLTPQQEQERRRQRLQKENRPASW
jgi:predicted Na+-dependent transporter